MHDVYLYGSTIVADSFVLKEQFPDKDRYAEFEEHHCTISGATGISLAILSNFGIICKSDGYHLGTYSAPIIREYFKFRNVDISSMKERNDFEGFHTYVFIDKVNGTRNCMGSYETLMKRKKCLYNLPDEQDVRIAKCVGIDPFIDTGSILTAKFCVKYGIPYVVIDCKFDSFLAQNCSIAILSEEFLSHEYVGMTKEEILQIYMNKGRGLYILTFGAKPVVYGRNGMINTYLPFHVNTVATWGAGDAFKCGCIYGLLHNMSDEKIIEFACALAGCACCGYPLAENLPSLRDVERLINERKKLLREGRK